MMKKPILSICYPTYNRGSVVEDNIKKTLQYKREDIEVVVLDNCSTDDTQERVLAIGDDRVKYYCNDYNIGFTNLIHVVRKATGYFSMVVSDEDYIYEDSIVELLKIIKKNKDCGFIFTSVKVYDKPYLMYHNHRYTPGTDIVLQAVGHAYITGIVYNTDLVNRMIGGLSVKDEIKEYGDSYPHVVLCVRIAAQENTYTTSVVVTNHEIEAKRDSSSNVKQVENSRLRSAYDPSSRKKQMLEISQALVDAPLSNWQKYYISVIMVRNYRDKGTTGYLRSIDDESLNSILGNNKENYSYEKINFLKYNFDIRLSIVKYDLHTQMFSVKEVLLYPFCCPKEFVKGIRLFWMSFIDYLRIKRKICEKI